MNNIIPLFSSQGSICRSLLTCEDETEIKDNSPVSIFAIAAQYGLNKLVVTDNSFLEFPRLYKHCNKYNIQLIFGLNLNICNNAQDKTESSLLSNCKVSVLMKNSEGYRDLIKLNNAFNAQKETFYYESRNDYNALKSHCTDNLQLLIPPHNNFLEKNLIFNGSALPDLGTIKPIMTYCDIELPYTQVVNPAIKQYAKENKYELQEVQPIYYMNRTDFRPYSVLRCISDRTKFNSPNINYMSSAEFCWESYLEKVNK